LGEWPGTLAGPPITAKLGSDRVLYDTCTFLFSPPWALSPVSTAFT
jgi:hypothetical protein